MRRVSWVVVAAFGAVTIYNVALALGFGAGRIRRYHDPPGASFFAAVLIVAVLMAFVLSLIAIARPNRVVALFVPMFALQLLSGDFTYDTYFAPQLQRYWVAAGDHTRILVGVVLAFVIGAGSWRWPRAAGATNLLALPMTFVLTIAYLGH